MKALTSIPLFIIIFTLAGHSSADQWVNGYSKSDGTYVQGHYRSSPDSYRYNNRNSQKRTERFALLEAAMKKVLSPLDNHGSYLPLK